MPIVLIIAILLAGGVSVASNNALPGDALYGVKVNVNENIREAFAFSDEAKAKAAENHAEERLEEAEKLSADGKLNEEVKADLIARFTAQAKVLDERLAKLNANGKANVSTELRAKISEALQTRISAIERTNAGLGQSLSGQFRANFHAVDNANSNANLGASANVNAQATSSANGQGQGTSTPGNSGSGQGNASSSNRGSLNLSL